MICIWCGFFRRMVNAIELSLFWNELSIAWFLRRGLFLSSFIQFILELNGITYVEEDFIEVPKLVDSIVIKLMRYFQDKKGIYYYLDNIISYVYEDMAEFPKENASKKKKVASILDRAIFYYIGSSSSALSHSSVRLLSGGAKAYIYEWFSKIVAYSHARESHIHDHFDMVAKEANRR